MTPNTQPPTAKIFQFPKRNPIQAERRGFDLASAADPRRLASVDGGTGWYHDRAIEEARTPGKP